MTRLWLLALLVLTAIVAGGVLFVKYQLEALRTTVQAEIEQRTGVLLDAQGVRVDGLRGLRMQALHVLVDSETGPTVEIHVPEALLRVNIADLLQGHVSISRIQLDNARIRLTRPRGNYWFTSDLAERSALAKPIPFRAVGRNCSIEIEHIVGDTAFRIDTINFDLNRLPDSSHIIANLDGHLDEGETGGFQVFARYASLENFDLRIQCDALDSQRLAPIFPLLDKHVSAGTAQPSIRVSGYPRRTMVLGLEVPFQDLQLRAAQDMPVPESGLLNALASYDVNTHLLTLNTAKTLSPEFEGQVEGTVSFAQDPPVLDLKLEVQQFAIDDIMALASGSWLEEHGKLTLEASDPYVFYVTFKGDATSPDVGVEAQLGAGGLRFVPSTSALPNADLAFNFMSLSWRSDGSLPTGRLSLSDGTINHDASGILAENITGTLILGDGTLAFKPLIAQIAGNTIRGSLDYTMASETLSLNLAGDLGAVEEIEAVANHPLLTMRGPVTINSLTGTISPKRYEIDAAADLTRTQLDWEWWLAKRPGIGARIQRLHIDVIPKKSITITGTAALDTAEINADIALGYTGKKWELQALDLDSPHIEMGTVDKVLNLPYTVSGGVGTEGHLGWSRTTGSPAILELRIGGHIDTLTMLPDGTNRPITGSDISIDTRVFKEGEVRTGTLTLKTASASLPPFGTPWLLPLRAEDDPSLETFPPLDRAWIYDLQADVISYPPWSGTNFSGSAYADVNKSGFKSFKAMVSGGSIGGMYSASKPDNVHQLDANWDKVPAAYLLEHLKLPEIFTGTMTGGIAYEVDKDDTGTLKGTGYFDVVDGQFSADYLFAQFERQIEEASITLPPSLRFTHFTADVALEGDLVKTTNMLLESDAVKISGNGHFVVNGDMDYLLRFSLPAATAKGVPALRTYFNLDGLKHSQTNLELTFHIFGPSFAPKMELEGLPSVGDTIVSGAVEVTSDVMKVVDLPRQILLDLFKIGGGIVGAGGKKAPAE